MSRIYHVISPHLDDAALSCALFLAANHSSCITTVFAGGPAYVRPLTQWDRAARYFYEGADVVGVRRGEDISAAAMVHASARHLGFWDRQYRNDQYDYDGVPEEDLTVAIADGLIALGESPNTMGLVIPLGLGHPDHRITAEASLAWAQHHTGSVYVYEELPYAVEDSAEVADRKRRLVERGYVLERDETLEFLSDRTLKTAMFRCHASQKHLLRRRAKAAIRTSERIWRLAYR